MKFVFIFLFAFFTLDLFAQTSGCTDPLASNYNSAATINDGSCVYIASTIAPVSSFTLSNSLNETSGLIQWGDNIYTHNDNTDKRIYALDSTNGAIVNTYSLQGITNIDWEEISQDDFYVYLGDFGNNANGNRTNLRIYKIDKASILNNAPVIDTIKFSYSNQITYTATGSNNTDFDCEAFIATADSIFLFTKQWLSQKTSLYALPKTAGTYTANYLNTLDVQGLITGATYVANKNTVTLCGYSNLLQPFFYLLYDFNGNKFFSANKRKVGMSLSFYQTEGITSKNGLKYYVSNEYFTQPPFITVPQQLSIFDLSSYFYGNSSTGLMYSGQIQANNYKLYPSIITSELTITSNSNDLHNNYMLSDMYGAVLLEGKLKESNTTLNLSELSNGVYFITLYSSTGKLNWRIIKQ